MKIVFDGEYIEDYREITKDNEELKILTDQRVIWFKNNPEDSRLDNHALTKKMADKYAFSITDDIRIVYEWTNKTTVRFLAIGPHKKVYHKN